MRPTIVLCGKRRCGKDTVAEYLASRHGFVNMKIAARLKEVTKVLFGLDDAHVEGALKDEVHPGLRVAPRALLQWLGTDVMQFQLQNVLPDVGRRFWITDLVRRMREKRGLEGAQPIVVSDARFMHEVDCLREAFPDMVLIRIVRDDFHSPSGHVSETEVDSVMPDHVISNSGTLSDLHQRVEMLMERLCRENNHPRADEQQR